MLLCCFRDSSKSDKNEEPRSKSGRRNKYRDEVGAAAVPGLTREDSSVSRISAGFNNEPGVILAPVTFHPVPSNYDPRQAYNRSTSVCSNSEQQSHSLSRQSSQQSNSHYGLVRPHSRDGSRRDKERAPLSKEAKRLLKQRSQDSFVQQHQPDLSRQSVSSIPFIDQTPPTAKQVNPDDDLKESYSITSTSPIRQFNDEKRRRSQSSTLSTPNLQISTTTSPSVTQQTSSTMATLQKTSFQSSSTQLSKIEEKIQGRGMCRSSASYGIQQMLQDQIQREENEANKLAMEKEMSKVVAACEERINAMKADHNFQIQQLLREKTTAVNNARNTFESEFQRRISELENNLRKQHSSELEKERSSHAAELEKVRRRYEEAVAEAEERHQRAIEQFQDRDQAWQNEKQEVLAEIQRLKEEASRFVAILSQEEEYEKSDQQLSPAKRQVLTKEVESLQLVVEMRTSEVRQLREERCKLLEQLEAFENTRNILEKMNARVEDLQAQLEAKNQVERQLSLENSKLENYYETEAKNKARMSMQVEELQWRIKHNLELPPTQIYSPGSPMSMDEAQWSDMTSGPMSMSVNQIYSFDEVVMRKQKTGSRSSTTTPRKENFYSNHNFEFDVWKKETKPQKQETNGLSFSSQPTNDEVPTPTTVQNNNVPTAASSVGMSGDGMDDREKRDKSTEKQIVANDNDNDDDALIVDSLENLKSKVDSEVEVKDFDDEGLGDINHGSEASSSPQPPTNSNLATSPNNDNVNNNEVVANIHSESFSTKSPIKTSFVDSVVAKTSPVKSLGSPCDERVPSRIPFSVQTNL